MKTSGQLLSETRKAKKISLKKASLDLHLKREQLEAIEEGSWQNLPEPTFVKSFIKTYSNYLGLDPTHVLALYRREYDETKYPHKASPLETKRRLMITPNKLINLVFVLIILAFILYLGIQYSSILSAPDLRVFTPPDDLTTSVPLIVVSGEVEKESIVAIDGQFVPIDSEGKFSYQLALSDGKNVITIIASKRLSPKTKVTKVIRLSR